MSKDLIELDVDDSAKGMSAASLRKSQAIRQDFIKRYGKVPSSVLLHNRTESNRDTIDLSKEGRGGGYVHHYNKNKRIMIEGKDFTPGMEKSGMVTQGRKNYLSAFPQNIGRTLIDFLCPKNGIVYDPFCGHNSRMGLCFKLNRNYIGVDVCHEFMEDNRKIKRILYRDRKNSLNVHKHNSWIRLIERSSSDTGLPDESADFSITSPPYYCLEYYGDEPEQLGNAKTYERFIELISQHVKENFRILRPDSFCCWFIADFRKNKKFHPFHIDLYSEFIKAGFEPFNIYIVDLGQTVNQQFVQVILKTKIFPKQHEYILIFIKP